MTTPSSLIVLTDDTGIESIYANEAVRPLVICPRSKRVKQILYVNVESFLCEAVVLLDEKEPFHRVPGCTVGGMVMQPNVSEVLDFVEPFECITSALYKGFMELPSHWAAPLKHNEGFLIDGVDIYGPIDTDLVEGEILDQFEIHRSSTQIIKCVEWMKTEGRNISSRVSEYIANEYADGGFESIEELPKNWEAALDFEEEETEEQKEMKRAQVISLLNSINQPFVAHPCDSSEVSS